jgi:hypothetical protein
VVLSELDLSPCFSNQFVGLAIIDTKLQLFLSVGFVGKL